MTEFMFSVGFRGVFAAWIARRTAMMNIGAAWMLGDGDIVTGKGYPSAFDLLFPDSVPAEEDRPDADLIADINRLTPHLMRPMRLVSGAPRQPGFLARLMGARKDKRERVDLGEHQAGKPLVLGSVPGVIERCQLVDSQRLTVALARDFHARGGIFFREEAPEAGFNLTDDRQYPENFQPRVAFIARRPYREDYAYMLFCEDNLPFLVVPIDQDLLLVERAVANQTPEEALKLLVVAYHAMFGLDFESETIVEVMHRSDGAECSTVQDLRRDERFLDGTIRAVAQQIGGSNPETAGMIDGCIEGSYGEFANMVAANYSHLDAAYVRGLVARHGPLAPEVLGQTHRDGDLGEDFGGGLMAREAKWILEQEFACDAEDIACRRGKFGLHGADTERLQAWIDRGAPLR